MRNVKHHGRRLLHRGAGLFVLALLASGSGLQTAPGSGSGGGGGGAPVGATYITQTPDATLTNEFVFGSSRNDLHITPLTDAFNEIKTTFEAANSGVTITYNFGASNTLATQLSQGAPADIFASANATQKLAPIVARALWRALGRLR